NVDQAEKKVLPKVLFGSPPSLTATKINLSFTRIFLFKSFSFFFFFFFFYGVSDLQMYPKVKVKVKVKVMVRQEEQLPELHIQSLSLYHHHHPSKSPDAGHNLNTKVNTNKPTSLLLRPRAVLSSPENDAMHATKNKTETHHSGFKNHNLRQNRHVKCNKSYQLENKNKSSSWEQ
ncbi:hypothetical protein Ccrd_006953, partial [Cynara cardunculus var. scolymus]